jgi:hypothetical protein
MALFSHHGYMDLPSLLLCIETSSLIINLSAPRLQIHPKKTPNQGIGDLSYELLFFGKECTISSCRHGRHGETKGQVQPQVMYSSVQLYTLS